MEQDYTSEMSASTAGFTLSAMVAMVFNTVLVWVKESNPGVNAYMKSLTGHHWITHGLAVVIMFLVPGFLFSKLRSVRNIRGVTLTYMLILVVILSGLGILGFFLMEGF